MKGERSPFIVPKIKSDPWRRSQLIVSIVSDGQVSLLPQLLYKTKIKILLRIASINVESQFLLLLT